MKRKEKVEFKVQKSVGQQFIAQLKTANICRFSKSIMDRYEGHQYAYLELTDPDENGRVYGEIALTKTGTSKRFPVASGQVGMPRLCAENQSVKLVLTSANSGADGMTFFFEIPLWTKKPSTKK